MSLNKYGVYCVYRHLKPNGEVFYVGIGSNTKRPYAKSNRSKYWKNKVKKYPNYEVDILKTGLSKEDACELETILISWYGRLDLETGSLVNLTNGGESTYGRVMEDWQREFMSETFKGRWVGKDNPNYGNKWTDKQKEYMSDLKKKQYETGEVKVNLEACKKGIEERDRRWRENPQLKIEMQKKISKKHNIYEYLKIDKESFDILEVYQNRLEVLDKNKGYKTSPLLSVCNGWKASYKGFIWRYRDRNTGVIIEPENKRKVKTSKIKK